MSPGETSESRQAVATPVFLLLAPTLLIRHTVTASIPGPPISCTQAGNLTL